jgi:hypothetical protein
VRTSEQLVGQPSSSTSAVHMNPDNPHQDDDGDDDDDGYGKDVDV